MGNQHKTRSKLSGPHPLARAPQAGSKQPISALQILREAFAQSSLSGSAASDVSKRIAESSEAGTLIVPRKGHHMPYHVLGFGQRHPWDLLPMRAAALKQYPNIFAEACLFFSSLQDAVHHNRPQRLLRCTKTSLDLAKLLRNLGILAGFEIVQNVNKCKSNDYMWPAGQEPKDYQDLSLYPYSYVKLSVRWDAYKPLWQPPSMSVLQEPLHTTDPLPFSVRHLSKPSTPTLMTPADVKSNSKRLPAGITIMYHPQLGLTVDAVTEQHDVPALALTHLALPWVQVAQIKAALRDKASSEKGLPLSQTKPLIEWRVSDWLAHTLKQREAQLLAGAASTNRQEEIITNQMSAWNKIDVDKAYHALMAGSTLHNELVAVTLMDKLRHAAALAASTSNESAEAAEAPSEPSSSQPLSSGRGAGKPAQLGSPSKPSRLFAQQQQPGTAGQETAGTGKGIGAAAGRAPGALAQGVSRGFTPTGFGSGLPPVGPSAGRHSGLQKGLQGVGPVPPAGDDSSTKGKGPV